MTVTQMILNSTTMSLVTCALALLLASAAIGQNDSEQFENGTEAEGTFAPTGPPSDQPVRVEAGGSCIIDLKQAYSISGTLSGSLAIDYRIIVYGPCETPPVPGHYDEEWIAHGTFKGRISESEAFSTFIYTAKVQAGGGVEGRIVIGDGVHGELAVTGNFGDGHLSYQGQIN